MSVPPPINVVASDPEERSMAALAHGSIVLNFFIPGLGMIAALAIWLTQRERSAYAARQALQATIYQIIWMIAPIVLVIVGVIVAVGGALGAAFADMHIGVVFLPVFLIAILAVVAIVVVGVLYALVAAYETYQGRDFHYWLIGGMIH